MNRPLKLLRPDFLIDWHSRARSIAVLLLSLITSGFLGPLGSRGASSVGAAENLALRSAIESITSDDLRRHVAALADDSFEGREAGTRGGHAAGMYLAQQFAKHKLRPAGTGGTYFQPFGNSCRNVIGIVEGSDPQLKQQYILVGAHYDHVGFGNRESSNGPIGYIHNGADDNASGVAGLLELAEALSKLPQPARRSIIFALWDSEEQGLYGSKHWVKSATVPLGQVVISINLDMIGKLRGDRLEVLGTRTSTGLRRLLSEQNQSTGLLLDFGWDMKADSDHYTFFAASMPSIMLHTGLHEDYHRPSDDANKLNYDGIHRVSSYMLRTTIALADEPDRRAFRKQSRDESLATQRTRERPAAAGPARFGVRWAAQPAKQQASEELLPRVAGVLLTEVITDSPADRAGLRAGDRIVRFAQRDVDETQSLAKLVLAASNPVEVTVERAGQQLSRPVNLAGMPVRIGIGWREDEAEPNSVAITRVTSGTPADEAGLRVLDRIYKVNGRDFDGIAEFEHAIRDQQSLELVVETNGRLRTVQLKPLESVGGALPTKTRIDGK